MRKGWFTKTLAMVFLLVFGYSYADAAPPQVIATDPPNGAVGVRPDIDTIQILLDQPLSSMGNISPGSNCITHSENWPAIVGPPDGLLIRFGRTTRGTDLPLGSHIKLTINPPGASSDCVKDMEGNLLPTYELNFTIRQNTNDPPIEPQVVSTDPPRGATGIDPNISSVSITFSKPMADTTDTRLGAWFLGYGWGSATRSWSPDGRTLTITRGNAGTPLSQGQTVILILNWGLSMRLQDVQGNILQEYAYYFTVEGDKEAFWESYSDVTITKISENPSKGFHWPYYLSIPNSLQEPTTLFVEPNNSGYPALDHIFHDVKAAELLYSRTVRVNYTWNLKLPILVPTFPRTYEDYIQSMNLWLPHNCNCPELERPDLQMIAMIEDAKERLRSMGHAIDDKVFMNGFSASGGFTTGFTFLHPDLIRAAASGGGLPSEYDPQRRLELEAATGTQIDLQTYFKVPLYLYVGDQDGNYISDLWLTAKQFYESGGANAQLVLYPGVGHTITEQMWSDLENFFERHNTIFSDISTIDYWAYYYILAIYNAHITKGCSKNPLKYCPEDNVTRGQMAAFIIRALYGESFAYTQTPYFTDVPSTHDFFKYVQKMKDTGITAVTGTYDVEGTVTRGQMAAFIIRALYGEGFAYTQTPYFTDVPSTHGFFKYVQKMKDDGITAVTGTYDVEGTVTRAQMAAFLSRAFLGME